VVGNADRLGGVKVAAVRKVSKANLIDVIMQ